MRNKEFLSLFKNEKPIIGMLHLKGHSSMDTLERAIREIDIYINNSIDGVIVENYFGDIYDVANVLNYLYSNQFPINYGVNVLGDYKEAFELADAYGAQFVQVDSVTGHLEAHEDSLFGEEIINLKNNSKAHLIGGVRFKYQPVLSGRTLEEDINLGIERSDGIVVTGSGTGIETNLTKIKEFRKIIADRCPLIIGAGITLDNVVEQLENAGAAIIGSYFKEYHVDTGELCQENVGRIMKKVQVIRR